MSGFNNESGAASGRLLPTNVVARRIGKCVRMVRIYAASGALRGTKVGKLWKFYESDVEAFRLRFCRPGEAA